MTDEQAREKRAPAGETIDSGDERSAESSERAGAQDAAAAGEAGGGEATADPRDPGPAAIGARELEELRQKASERDTFLDELRRSRAELENYQKRVRRERPHWEEQAAGRVFGDLLVVVDNFERALESIHADDERTRSIEEGVRMIYQLVLRVLGEHGVEEIPATGAFDPAVHEALVEEEVEDRRTGEITGVLEKGYKFRASVLRPAKVKVARNVSDTAEARSARSGSPAEDEASGGENRHKE